MQGQGDGVCCGPVAAVGKLYWIEAIWETAIDLCHDWPFEALHNDGCQSHRTIVIKARCLVFLRYRDDGHLLEADRDLRLF